MDQINQAAEQAGLSGTRWSSPLGRTAQDIAGRTMAKTGLEWTGREMDALEAARGRQMQGINQLQGFGAGEAQLGESARNRALSAAGGLQGLGQDYLQAPQDWAERLYGMGTGQYAQSQSALDKYYKDYMRMTPENNPWLQMAMGLTGESQSQPSQWTTGGGIMDLIGPILSILAMM